MKKTFGFLLILFVLAVPRAYSAASSDQYLAAGNTLYDQKNYDKAILYYKAAIQVDPNNAAAHTRLANTYYMLGQKSEALTQYQAALALNPNNAQLSAFVQKLQAQVGSAPAQTGYTPAVSATPAAAETGLYLGIGPGVDLPQTQGVTTMGVGIEAFGGYAFDKNFSARLEIDAFFSSPVTNISVTDIRVYPGIKYAFDGKGFQPYLLGGVGYDMYGESVTGSSTSASLSGLAFIIGGGAQFDLGNKLKAFVELKYNSASLSSSSSSSSGGSSPSTSYSDIPVTAGILIGL